jgi:hypothetical protein
MSSSKFDPTQYEKQVRKPLAAGVAISAAIGAYAGSTQDRPSLAYVLLPAAAVGYYYYSMLNASDLDNIITDVNGNRTRGPLVVYGVAAATAAVSAYLQGVPVLYPAAIAAGAMVVMYEAFMYEEGWSSWQQK